MAKAIKRNKKYNPNKPYSGRVNHNVLFKLTPKQKMFISLRPHLALDLLFNQLTYLNKDNKERCLPYLAIVLLRVKYVELIADLFDESEEILVVARTALDNVKQVYLDFLVSGNFIVDEKAKNALGLALVYADEIDKLTVRRDQYLSYVEAEKQLLHHSLFRKLAHRRA